MFRRGPETVAGDRFRLGSVLDEEVLLLRRKRWELFSWIWPGCGDPFSARMNAVPRLVTTRTLAGTSVWGELARRGRRHHRRGQARAAGRDHQPAT
jgi:hypothetical protein